MRAMFSRLALLVAALGLVGAPVLASGYDQLHRAEQAWAGADYPAAAGHYVRALRLMPWRTDRLERAGTASYLGGERAQAIGFLERAARSDALSASGWGVLGFAYLARGDELAACRTWESGLERFPGEARFHLYLADLYREAGRYSEEFAARARWLRSGEALSGLDPAREHFRLGSLCAVLDPACAVREFYLAASLAPEYDSAVETMRTTLDLASLEDDEAGRLVVVGRGLGLVGDWALAAEAFRRATAADPGNAQAHAWLGVARQQVGEDGRSDLELALALDPSDPVVRSLRGLSFASEDRPREALEEYRAAAGLEPLNPQWQLSIGEAHAQAGDLQAALAAYLSAVELAPEDYRTWMALAAFCARYEAHLEDFGLPAARMAVELSGEDPLALDTLGWTLALTDRETEAREALEHALDLDPGLAEPHLHLGLLALREGDWEAARDHLGQARDLDPHGAAGGQAGRLLDQYFP